MTDVELMASLTIRVHLADLGRNRFADVVAATFAAGSFSIALAG